MSPSAAAMLENALREIAGADAAPTSITVDYGVAGVPVAAKAWIERSTRSLIFAQAEVRTEQGTMVAAASAVFRRVMSV